MHIFLVLNFLMNLSLAFSVSGSFSIFIKREDERSANIYTAKETLHLGTPFIIVSFLLLHFIQALDCEHYGCFFIYISVCISLIHSLSLFYFPNDLFCTNDNDEKLKNLYIHQIFREDKQI